MLTFCREHGIGQRDRTWHELSSLVQILWLAATYDCLNLGSLACLESVARRLATITEAYRANPNQPSWEMGRFLSGTLRLYANRAARDEADRLTALSRGQRGGGRGGAEDTAGAAAAGGLPRAGGDKGGGKAPNAQAKVQGRKGGEAAAAP